MSASELPRETYHDLVAKQVGDGTSQPLSEDERRMLDYYRQSGIPPATAAANVLISRRAA